VIATAFCGGFRCLGRQYSSSFALACGYAARLPYGEVSGGHPDGVIELRLLPPGFTEPGCTGIDLMPSQDQIRAVAPGRGACVADTGAAGRRPLPDVHDKGLAKSGGRFDPDRKRAYAATMVPDAGGRA
jgi:hypothetical protein